MSIVKKAVSMFLTTAILAPMCLIAPGISAGAAAAVTISDLKVCETSNPVGIDTTPTFSWVLSSDGYDKSQTAYKIIVSSTRELAEAGRGDLWYSGKVSAENNYDVEYAGQDLQSKTTYYWTVEVWDETGKSIGKSEISSFSTGIFSDDEWQGDWIGMESKSYDLTLDGAYWIWKRAGSGFGSTPEGTQYIRKSFTLDADKTVQEVLIGFSADDQSELYFNGVKQAESAAWSTGGLFDATNFVTDGTNVMAVSGYNSSTGYAGIIAKIQITYTDGTTQIYKTDTGWKMTDTASDGWYDVGFDDSSWGSPDQAVLFGQSPWGTGVSLEVAGSRSAVTLRKEFDVSKTVESAFVYVCGLGFFDLTVNGTRPDDSLLNPCNTQYDQTVLYRTFDVTDLLNSGEANAVGVELGNSFYNETSGVWSWGTAIWRDNPKLLFNLEITYSDGTTDMIVSDTSWSVTNQGPTVSNGIYYGETYDARKELTGFDMAGYDDSAWLPASVVEAPTGELVCQVMDPVKRTQSYTAQSIMKLDNGSYVVTAPEMVAGWMKLMNIQQEAGSKITITYGEKLNSDGTVQKLGGTDGVNSNWWPEYYIMQDNYIAKGTGDESFEPKFSYKGFEYIQIDGYEGDLTADDLAIYRTANDVDIVSEVETSNDMINQLHQIMRTTMLNNFQGKPTDTPVWEKNGWLGDANVALQTMMYNFDMSNFLPNFIEIMEDCFDYYGTVPNMVPTADWGVDNSAVWNTIFVYGVAELCNYYGMTSYSDEQYDVMRQFALKDIDAIQGNGWVWYDGQLSDWVSPIGGSDPDVQYNENQSEGSGIAGSCFVYGMLDAMASFADQMDKTEDAAEYRAAMDNIKSAFNAKFYNSDEQIYETTTWTQIGTRTEYRQTSNLLALAFGMVPDEYVDGVVSNLINDIVEKDYHLDTGCVGTKYILPVLCDYGYTDVAYKIMTQDTYPSWGYWLTQEATSTWEMWESTARSHDHYFLGTYDEWIYSDLAGITDIEDGYKTFTIQPYMIGDLDYVTSSVDTVRGELKSAWSLNADGTATVEVTVPFGSTAKIVLPTDNAASVTLDGAAVATSMDGIQDVSLSDGQVAVTAGSGSYTFVTAANLNTVYKDTLSEAIATAQSTDVSALPQVLKDALSSTIASAQAVYDKADAIQYEVNAAAKSIENMLTEITGSEARQALSAAAIAAAAQTFDAQYYPADTLAAYESALLTAQKLAANYDIPDEQLAAAKEQLSSALTALQNAKSVNLALDKSATASSSNETDYWGWGLSLITDGDTQNINRDNDYAGYCSNDNSSVDHTEWVNVDLGAKQELNQVVLYAACANVAGEMIGYGFPSDFEIQVSDDAQNWTAVYSATDYAVPGYGPQTFDFDTVSARYVRLYATSLNPKVTDGNSYRLQISEFEVYKLSASAETSALTYAELSSGYLSPIFNIGTHQYTATVSRKTDSITVTGYTHAGDAAVINGQSCESGTASSAIPLRYGSNAITLSAGSQNTVITVYREPLKGDLDNNGTVTVSDVVEMRSVIMQGNADENTIEVGDLDDTGTLTVSDVVELRAKIIAGNWDTQN